MLRKNTPLERHTLSSGKDILVKREDLCINTENASFSKLRGVSRHLQGISEKYVGILDSFHSKAGWGTSALCRELGKTPVVFYPVYKGETELRENQRNAKALGAELVPLQAGRSCILYHRAKVELERLYPGTSYMMPNALKLEETVLETAEEVEGVPDCCFGPEWTWVISISSGTVASGVIQGILNRKRLGQIPRNQVVLHLGYSRSPVSVRNYIRKKAGMVTESDLTIHLVDEGYDYKAHVDYPSPFPCNKYYDLKAWKWLVETGQHQHNKILFWNIGD